MDFCSCFPFFAFDLAAVFSFLTGAFLFSKKG
jgi:hypothetical protein